MSALIERDLKHLWHPCSQMKDYEGFPPLEIESASGSELKLKDGRVVLDAISSWWCKSLGHGEPRLKRALQAQLDRFEHVILANTTNETIVALTERLSRLTPGLTKVFYAGDGSTAVEVALKMALHAHQLRGNKKKSEMIALRNGYHGETLATLSLSDLGLYKDPYQPLLHRTHFLGGIPYVTGRNDPLWADCSSVWAGVEAQLSALAARSCSLVVEPVVQGAGGMRVYSPDFLRRLRAWCDDHDVYLIADEILTGFGRTGKPLAMHHAGVEADFVTLSKGLTAGWMAMSAVLCSDSLYDLFYDEYQSGKAFLHSNTYCGNALAAAVALEALTIYEEPSFLSGIERLEGQLRSRFETVAHNTSALQNIRGIGGMVAGDLVVEKEENRWGYQVFQRAVELGALLRPLGNTIYWFPPLNISETDLDTLQSITQEAITGVLPSIG